METGDVNSFESFSIVDCLQNNRAAHHAYSFTI